MDDLEKAILVIFNQSPVISPDVRAQATSFCEKVQTSADGWRLCWQQFLQKDNVQVKFWCLRVISLAIANLPSEARIELRSTVLAYWHGPASHRQEDVMIRNKLALIYVNLLKMDYPEVWQSAWRDVVASVTNGAIMVDLYLRVLVVFDEEVVSDDVVRSSVDRQRTHTIKHAMRQSDVALLAESWYNILNGFRRDLPLLIAECCKVVGLFAVWIDITVLANETFLDAICGVIADGGPAAGEACDALASILEKKMPAEKKVQLFQQMRILQRLDGCVHLSSADQQLHKQEGQLFNRVSEEVLDAYEELRLRVGTAVHARHCWECLRALLPKLFNFFSHQEFQVAETVEPFFTSFFTKIKGFMASEGQAPDNSPSHQIDLDEVRPILMQTLQVVIRRMAYPDWFQHEKATDDEDDHHLAFLEFRKNLTKIYRRIFLLDERMGYDFLQASITQLTQQLSVVKPMEAEAILFLFKETGEFVRDLRKHLQGKGPLTACFVQIVECDRLLKADHWAVQLALLEIYVRYGSLFAVNEEWAARYCLPVLQAIAGAQGIRSHDSRVVGRACFMFPRFVKLARLQIMKYIGQVYDALQELLAVPFIPSSALPVPGAASATPVLLKGGLRVDDQASLYEGLATLVAALPAGQLEVSLQLLLKAPVSSAAEILSTSSDALAADARGFAEWAARSVEVMANISRPFTSTCAPHCAAHEVWQQVLQSVAKILELFGAAAEDVSKPTWTAVLFLCRRMVEVLGSRFLQPLDALLQGLCAGSKKPGDLNEILVFAHHIVHQFPKETEPFLRKWLPSLFAETHQVWAHMPQESEQLKREKIEIATTLLQLLKEVGLCCPGLLLEAMTRPEDANKYGRNMGSFLLVCISDIQELKAAQMAVATWASLFADPMVQGNPEALRALEADRVLQQALWSAARMDLSDLQAHKVLNEISSILQNTAGKLMQNPAHQQAAADGLLKALGSVLPGLLSEALLQKLCQALAQDADRSQVTLALQQLVMEWRRTVGDAR